MRLKKLSLAIVSTLMIASFAACGSAKDTKNAKEAGTETEKNVTVTDGENGSGNDDENTSDAEIGGTEGLDHLSIAGSYAGKDYTAELSMYTSPEEGEDGDTSYGTINLYKNSKLIVTAEIYQDEAGMSPWNQKYELLYSFTDESSAIYNIGFKEEGGTIHMDLGSLREFYETLDMTEHYQS